MMKMRILNHYGDYEAFMLIMIMIICKPPLAAFYVPCEHLFTHTHQNDILNDDHYDDNYDEHDDNHNHDDNHLSTPSCEFPLVNIRHHF